MGLPAKNRKGEDLTDIIADVVGDLLDGLSKVKRRDADAVENAVQRAVRAVVNEAGARSPPAMCSSLRYRDGICSRDSA